MRRSCVIVGLTLSVGACGPSVVVEPPPVRASLEVAANLPLSGELAGYGGVWRQVIELAIAQVEAAGGVEGHELVASFYDNASQPDLAEQQCESIAAGAAVAMIGPGTSASVERCLPTIAGGLVTISGSSTAPHLGGDDDGGYLFRTVASDAWQADVLAHDAATQGVTSLAVAYAPSWEALRDRLEDALAVRGVDVLASAALDANPAATWSALEGAPAIAFLGSAPDLLALVETAPTLVDIFAAGAADPSFGAALFELAPNLRLVANTHAHTAAFASFAAAYPHPPHTSFGPSFYDATLLLALALDAQIAAGETPGGEGLREALHAVSRPPGALVGPGELAGALTAPAVDYDGAGGACDFDPAGEVRSPFAILRPDPSGLVEVAVVEPDDL